MTRVAEAPGVSRSQLYPSCQVRGPQERADDAEPVGRIRELVLDKSTFGYLRVTAALRRAGVHVTHKHVFRLKKRHQLVCGHGTVRIPSGLTTPK